MREYRLYCLDHEGKSVEARSLAAPSDEEAIRRAAALPGLRQCEVWRGNRLIAKVTDFNATEEHCRGAMDRPTFFDNADIG